MNPSRDFLAWNGVWRESRALKAFSHVTVVAAVSRMNAAGPSGEALLSTIGDPYQAGAHSHGRPLAGRKHARRFMADNVGCDAAALPRLVAAAGVLHRQPRVRRLACRHRQRLLRPVPVFAVDVVVGWWARVAASVVESGADVPCVSGVAAGRRFVA